MIDLATVGVMFVAHVLAHNTGILALHTLLNSLKRTKPCFVQAHTTLVKASTCVNCKVNVRVVKNSLAVATIIFTVQTIVDHLNDSSRMSVRSVGGV